MAPEAKTQAALVPLTPSAGLSLIGVGRNNRARLEAREGARDRCRPLVVGSMPRDGFC